MWTFGDVLRHKQQLKDAKKEKPKLYFLRDLEQYDARNNDCAVRQLEMCVDMTDIPRGYNIQFWKDVQLYGVSEAIMYVRNYDEKAADRITAEWNAIKERVDEDKPIVEVEEV